MTTIEQEPLYPQLPVGQEVIFVVSNNTIVATQTNVRFIADVYVSDTTAISPTTTTIPTATFKTTPNNAGVGIFDFRQVVENYVSADNMAANNSEYKGTLTTDDTPHPIHLIDKFSINKKGARWLTIQFKTQYIDANGDTQIDTPQNSVDYCLSAGNLSYDDIDLVCVPSMCLTIWYKQYYEGNIHTKLNTLFPNAKIKFVSHHLSHAASTVFSSDFNEGSFLILDGAGSLLYNHSYQDVNHVETNSIGYFNKEKGIFRFFPGLENVNEFGNYYFSLHLVGCFMFLLDLNLLLLHY